MQGNWRYTLNYLEKSYYVQQLAPLALVLIVPIFAFFAERYWSAVSRFLSMVFRNLGLSVAWNWVHDHGGSESSDSDKKSPRRAKVIRTRSEQVAIQNSPSVDEDATEETTTDSERNDDYYYPGLVNISGTYCFLNSVLQAMTSLSYLRPYIDAIQAKAEELDVPTPVVDSVREMLEALNTPSRTPRSLRPVTIINALSNPEPGKRSKLFSSREHQDAQELFQLLSECIKNESLAIDKEGQRDRGLGGLAADTEPSSKEAGQSVFDGLTANRRSCCECGYTEALMHFAFDNWQLAVPRSTGICTLQDCLSDYIKLELLTDCICRKCSMLATHQRLLHEAEKLSEAVAIDSSPSSSKKKRAREARRFEARVKAAIEEGRIEEDIKGVQLEKVFSKASTKQAMIARPPRVLALHLNRSVHYGNYTGRNACRIVFPEILDLTPYTTSGQMSTLPSAPISAPSPPIPRSTTPTQSTFATPRVLYRLSSVVCHYGQHSSGHYVCFRRRPWLPANRPSEPTSFLPHPELSCPIGCECEDCITFGHVRDPHPPPPGRGWLRISDDAVSECGIERVLSEGVGAFMLFYERVIPFRPPIYLMNSPRSSEETVKPELKMSCANGSTWSVSSLGERKDIISSVSVNVPGPRIVTRTTAGIRPRSGSVLSSIEAVNGSEKLQTEKFDSLDAVISEPLPNGDMVSDLKHVNGKPVEFEEGEEASTISDSLINQKMETKKRQLNGDLKHSSSPSHEQFLSQPQLNISDKRTSSPSPSRSSSSKSRSIKAPQPVRAHLTNGNVPVRLGLLA